VSWTHAQDPGSPCLLEVTSTAQGGSDGAGESGAATRSNHRIYQTQHKIGVWVPCQKLPGFSEPQPQEGILRKPRSQAWEASLRGQVVSGLKITGREVWLLSGKG
jgi:hypothetical protein